MMNWRKHFIEAATLIGAAVVCALISNAIAGRERKMAIVGNYGTTGKPAVAAPLPSQQQATTTTIAPPATTTIAPIPPAWQPSNPATQQRNPQPPPTPATPVTVQANHP